MHFARRLLGWTVVLGCAMAVGGGVFFFVRHRPRCTIEGPLAQIHLSSDGSRLVTVRTTTDNVKLGPQERGATVMYGPLQVWDMQSGHVVHEWFHDEKILRHVCPPDGRHVAIDLGNGAPRLVDTQTGEEWCFDDVREVANQFVFSPKGGWLFVGTASGRPNYLIDVAAHRVALPLNDYWPRFSSDDKLVYFRKHPARNLTVWDLQAGKALGALAITSSDYEISADGRLLLERHVEEIPEPLYVPIPGLRIGGGTKKIERKDYRVDVWDLATFKHLFHHEVKQAGNLQAGFSPDGRFLAMWLRGEKNASNLEMIDTAAGKRLWSYAMKAGYNCDFSPDEPLFAFVHGEPKETLTMFDAATGRVLWERRAEGTTYFARNTDIVLTQEDFTKPVLFLDARTGEQRATVPLNFTTANYIPMLTPDGRHFAIGGWQTRGREPYYGEAWLEKHVPAIFGNELEGVMVMESATGRELLRVLKRDAHSHELSADASTLITIEPLDNPGTVFAIRAWDVHPTKAWIWALGATLGAGLGGRFIVLPLVRTFRKKAPKAA